MHWWSKDTTSTFQQNFMLSSVIVFPLSNWPRGEQCTSNSIGRWGMAVTAIIWLINEWGRLFPQSREEEIYFAMSIIVPFTSVLREEPHSLLHVPLDGYHCCASAPTNPVTSVESPIQAKKDESYYTISITWYTLYEVLISFINLSNLQQILWATLQTWFIKTSWTSPEMSIEVVRWGSNHHTKEGLPSKKGLVCHVYSIK